MNKVLIETTADGSHTLFVPDLNEHYHSVNGAIQESRHVFIEAGLKKCLKNEISVLEIGFGTGLNAYLTLLYSIEEKKNIFYSTVELHPLVPEIINNLNYTRQLPGYDYLFSLLHGVSWDTEHEVTPTFCLKKVHTDFSLLNYEYNRTFDLIYFDAFAPEKQPSLWTQEIFDFIYKQTNMNGIIVTYCAKGAVRRMIQSAGFIIERLPGPPGKREMLRGIKK